MAIFIVDGRQASDASRPPAPGPIKYPNNFGDGHGERMHPDLGSTISQHGGCNLGGERHNTYHEPIRPWRGLWCSIGSRDKGTRFPKGQTGVMPSFANNGIEAKNLTFLILGICILKSSPKFTCGSADEDLDIKIMQWRVKSLLTTAGSPSGVSGTS